MRNFATVRRNTGKIDHNRIGRVRLDRARDEQPVAKIEGGLKAKSLELLLPLEALVFVPMNQPDRFP